MQASKDYMDNMFGASYVSQFLKRKKEKEAKEKASKEEVDCGRDDAKPCGEGRGEVNQGKIGEVKTSSATTGEKNEVMSLKQKEKRAKEFEENRKKAPAMKNLTKKQKEEMERMGPPKPNYMK